METSWLITLLPYVIALVSGGGVAALITALATNKKMKSEVKKSGVDAAEVLAQTALTLITPLRVQVEDLVQQLLSANTQIKDLQRQVDLLTTNLSMANQMLLDYRQREDDRP